MVALSHTCGHMADEVVVRSTPFAGDAIDEKQLPYTVSGASATSTVACVVEPTPVTVMENALPVAM